MKVSCKPGIDGGIRRDLNDDREPLNYKIRLYLERKSGIYEKLKKYRHGIRDRKYFAEKKAVMQKRIREKNIILLSNDCVGGMVLKDFSMPSYTPMVNVSFNAADFLKICENPDRYFSDSLEMVRACRYPYPVCKCRDVTVYCAHAKNFEEAKRSWDIGCKNYIRAKKFDYEICVVMSERFHFDGSMIERFENLPYKHKILFTKEQHPHHMSVFYMGGEEDKKELSSLTDYEGMFSMHRRYERFDFFQWFLEMYDEEKKN